MDKSKSQTAFVIGAIVIAVLSLAAYIMVPAMLGPTIERTATKVYFADHISPAHQLVIDRFNKIHEGRIEVVPVNLPFDKFTTNERKELLARSLRSKSDRLDIFSVDHIWVPRFAKWCEPLDEYITKTQRSAILNLALQSCVYESTLVSLPLYIDVGVLYYRRDLLRRLPDSEEVEARLKKSISWEELFRLKRRLGFEGRPYYIFQANEYEGLVCNYFELLAQKDRTFFSQSGIDLTTPVARAALQQMVDFVKSDRISPAEVTEFDENRSYEYMLDHDAMFVRGWPNFIENFRKTYRDTSKLGQVGRAAMPHFGNGRPAAVFGGWNVMISKASTKKNEALEFLRFLQSKEAQEVLFEAGGFIPVNNRVYEDSLFMTRHPDLQYYHELLADGFHRPALVDYTRISDIISHYVRAALKGDLSVDEALQKASAMIRTNKVLIK